MTCVDVPLRSQANALSVLFTHLLGDFPSPFLIGLMNDTVGEAVAMLVLVGWLAWGWVFWYLAWHFAVIFTQGRSKPPSPKGSLYACLCCLPQDSS